MCKLGWYILSATLVCAGTVRGAEPLKPPPEGKNLCPDGQVRFQSKCFEAKDVAVFTSRVDGWRKDCATSKVEMCIPLGQAYLDGNLVPRAPDYALYLFKRACDAGSGLGCAMIGSSYRKGAGVAKDDAKAAEWTELACKKKHSLSCSNLGHMYERGVGVPKDMKKALSLYQQACEQGVDVGCHNAELSRKKIK